MRKVLIALFINSAFLPSMALAGHPPPMIPMHGQDCPLPTVPAAAQVVLFSVYDGQAVSSAWIGSHDMATDLTEVEVEPGKSPLYVVLASHNSMVWRFRGATHRIARVVVRSFEAVRPAPHAGTADQPRSRTAIEPVPSASGVMGIRADRVTIADSHCWNNFKDPASREAKISVASIERTTGRKVDAIFGRYSAQRVSLPSGLAVDAVRDAAIAPEGFDEIMWRDARRYWPAGLTFVDPRKIVARVEVRPYAVLPSQMGLARLIAAGAIEPLPDGRFRIVEPIAHLPSGMGGAHSAKFVLAKGVPRPPGDPVHSCMVSEETGEELTRSVNCSRGR